MDLHPDVEERMGLLPGRRITAPTLHAVSRAAYRGADFVVALGPYMAERVRSRLKETNSVQEIPVWSRADEIWPVGPKENRLRSQLGYGCDDFVVMYSGNAGMAHRFEEVLVAMEHLRNHEDIHFLFVGGGPKRRELEREAAARRLPRFAYRDYFSRDWLALSLSVGDIHLLTLREDMAGLVAPSKLYGIMAAGRPTIMVGPPDSEPGATIREARIGTVLAPTVVPEVSGRVLAEEILRFRDSADVRRETGDRARRVFMCRYEKDIACRQWAALLSERVGD
jgi:glycosyltransferase involved in cell wall biosynthesis